jgi:gliding motility-associated-like protein
MKYISFFIYLSSVGIFTTEAIHQVEATYGCDSVCFESMILEEPEVIIDCDTDITADDLNNDLIVHFDFDGDARDNSPFMSQGSISGADATADRFGTANSAMNFTSNEEITIPKEDRFEIIFPFSISFWAYFETSGALNQGGIFSSNFSQDDYSGIIVNRNENGQISCQVGNGTGSISPASTKSMVTVDEIPKDKWTHIAIRLNGPNSGDIFIDGCEVPTFYGGSGVWNIVYRNVPMKIGRTDTSSDINVSENYLHGSLDDFYFWNRIISEDEILYLYDRFEVPAINIADATIDCGELISIEIPSIFTNVVWSDDQVGNIGAFSTGGFYSVQGLYNCIPVCTDFFISVDSEMPLDLQDTIQTCDTLYTLESPFDVLWDDGTFGRQIEVDESGSYKLFNICGVEIGEVFVDLLSDSDNLKDTYSICSDEQISIALPDIYDDVSWSNGTTGNVFTISEEGSYAVEYSNKGCQTLETFTVEVQRCEVCEFYTANIFNPNSSSGNAIFQIKSNNPECLENSVVSIFDRWGNNVFKEKSNIPWDGLSNGKPVLEGVYVFHISGSIGDDIISQYGNVTVIY